VTQLSSTQVRREQLSAAPEEFIDIDALVDALQRSGQPRPQAMSLMARYLAITTDLPIDDLPIRRICQVMTSNGCPTYESCEGHAKYLPLILFDGPNQRQVSTFAHVLDAASPQKNFVWQIGVVSHTDPLNPIRFRLQPISKLNERIDPAGDRSKLMFDIHYIGLATLAYFGDKAV
jgi:hypothetical protein